MLINVLFGKGFGLLTGLRVNLKKLKRTSSKHILAHKEILAEEDLLGRLLVK